MGKCPHEQLSVQAHLITDASREHYYTPGEACSALPLLYATQHIYPATPTDWHYPVDLQSDWIYPSSDQCIQHELGARPIHPVINTMNVICYIVPSFQ